MSAPISINSSTASPHGPTNDPITKHSATQAQAQLGHGHQPSTSISSTISSASSPSPQTPFSPSFSLSPLPPSNPPAVAVTGTSPNPKSPILQWASTSFGSLGKSPSSAPMNVPQFNHDHDHEHDHESHDAFEFGDISDLTRSSWTGHTRRTASMSNPSGVAAGALGSSPSKPMAPGGISAMLSGFGAGGGTGVPSGASGVPVGSPPSVAGGVFAENAAKGQGLLRRLSLGGAGRGRPNIAPPPSMPQPQSAMPASVPIPAAPIDNGNLSPDKGGVGFAQRGRRYSENPGAAGKKRGVSPMGERLLRDHGHF